MKKSTLLHTHASKMVLFIVFLSVTQFSLFAQTFQPFLGERVTMTEVALDKVFKTYEVYRIDSKALSEYVQNKTQKVHRLNLSLGIHDWDIKLIANDMRSQDYKAYELTEKGQIELPQTANTNFIGGVESGKKVSLSVNKGFIYGFIGDIYIEPLRHFLPNTEEDVFIVYRQQDVIPNPNLRCGATDKERFEEEHHETTPNSPELVETISCRRVKVAIRTDFSMYLKYGDVTTLRDYTFAVMNNVQSLYLGVFNYDSGIIANDDIRFTVVETQISAISSSDFSFATDAYALRSHFVNWALSIYGFKNTFDLGQFWTARDFYGVGNNYGTAGLAFINGICNPNERFHILENFIYSSASDIKVLTAHEIGHNFGAQHSLANSGFIMQPTINPNATIFSSVSLTEMNLKIISTTCLPDCKSTDCQNPTNLTTSNVTSFDARLSCDKVYNATAYKWQIRTRYSQDWTELGTTTENYYQIVEPELERATEYEFQVCAKVNEIWCGCATGRPFQTKPCRKPTISGNGRGVSLEYISIVEDIFKWRICRSDGTQCKEITTTTGYLNLTNLGLALNVQYYVQAKITCIDNYGEGGWSNKFMFIQGCNKPKIQKFELNSVFGWITITSDYLDNYKANDGVKVVELQYRQLGSQTWISITNGSGYFELRNLLRNTTYQFRVRHNCIDNSFTDWSDIQEFPQAGNQKPVVAITSPNSNNDFSEPATITINATATDTDGSISKVEFYNGTILLGTDNTAPYSYNWQNVPEGTYTLTAKAYDNENAVGVSAPVTIIVKKEDNCSNFQFDPNPITLPVIYSCDTRPYGAVVIGGKEPYKYKWSNGSTENYIPGNQPGKYSLTVTDANNCSISKEIEVPVVEKPVVSIQATKTGGCSTNGGEAVATVTKGKSPYSYFWGNDQNTATLANVAAGTYTLTVNDDNGCITQATVKIDLKTVVVSVSNIRNNQATVSFNALDAGASYRVEYRIVGQSNWSSVNAMTNTSVLLTSLSANTNYEVRVVAICTNNSSESISNVAQFKTLAAVNIPPSVSITLPTNNANFTAPATITINATATDADGTISKVEFYNGTTLLGSDNTMPYQFTWQNVQTGTYTITAKATDNTGASATSSPISITVIVPLPIICKCTDFTTTSFCDDFNSYALGAIGPQSNCWTTWSGSEGGAEDGTIRDLNGNKYMRIQGTNSAGGAQDVVLKLGDRKTGKYTLKFKFYIYNADKGYFNILNSFATNSNSNAWLYDVYFDGYGAGRLQVGSTYYSFNYTAENWIDVIQEFDLDNRTVSLTVDGKLVRQWSANYTNLSAINFYPVNTTYRYFIDDLSYNKINNTVCVDIYDPVCGSDGKEYGNSCYAERAGVTWTKGKCPVYCPAVYDPVCGSDGKEYGNSCYAEQAGVTWTKGKCPVYCPAVYDPVCGSDGKEYSNSCYAEQAGVTWTKGKCPVVCVDIYDPVCGSDGKEYGNSCYAERAGVTWTKGKCPVVCPAIYDPVCGSDGKEYGNSCYAEKAGVTWTRGTCNSNTICKVCTSSSNDSWCDDFQSYSTVSSNPEGGILGPQSPCWTTWSGIEGGSEDGIIRQLTNGSKYLRLLGGGSQDVVLQLGNKTSGKYQLKFKFLIYPENKGYYSVLSTFSLGGANVLREQEVYFNGYGAGRLDVFGTSTNFTYATTSAGVWIDIVQDFDLDSRVTKLTIDGRVVKEWTLSTNRLSGINFYPIDNTYRFFIDDVVLEKKAPCICTLEYNPVCGSDGRTYTNACAARCAGVAIVSCFGSSNPENLVVNIIPNPMNNFAKAFISVREEQDAQITIRDLQGRKVQEAKIRLVKGDNEWQIDSKYFSVTGIYIFSLQTNQGVITKKIVYTK